MISLVIANVFGWLWAHKRTIGVIVAVAVIAVAVLVIAKSCGRGKPVLNEKELQEVNEAIETRERKKMEEVFVKVEAKQAEIEANVTNAKAETVNAIADAKKKVSEMSDEELAAYLESLK